MKFLLKLSICFLNLIFFFFKLLPVRKKIVFISRQANSKTEDMELLEKSIISYSDTTPEMVFLCKKLESGIVKKIGYCFHLLKQMYHIATAKVVILDSYCISVSVLHQRSDLVVIQMWHALGALKKFGFSIVGEGEGRDKDVAEIMGMHRNYTWILTSGKRCVPYFAEAFGYEESRIITIPLPRVDKMTDKYYVEDVLERIYIRYPLFKEKKVVLYAPTFRKNKDISKDIEDLAKEFNDDEYIFVVKKHPLMNVDCKFGIIDNDFSTLDMLFAADYVICDYSAVVFEAALLNKPLFFYNFDYAGYSGDRNFYIKYMEEMPGIISADPKELALAIKEDRYDLENVKNFSCKYIDQQSGCSSKFTEFIMSNI